MNTKKILLLLTLGLPFLSCTYIRSINSSEIINPPNKNFVKVYKELVLTRCTKKKAKGKKEVTCESRTSWSTGSGLILDIVPGKVVAMTAGHVCSSASAFAEEDKIYKYFWNEKIVVLNYNAKFYKATIIAMEQESDKSSDLCAIRVPGLEESDSSRSIKMSLQPPKIGESIYYMGAPAGIYHPPTALIVKGNYSGSINKFSSLVTLKGAPGASGSVIMSLDHKAYGILYAVHPTFDHATVATSYDATRGFLNKIRKILNKEK